MSNITTTTASPESLILADLSALAGLNNKASSAAEKAGKAGAATRDSLVAYVKGRASQISEESVKDAFKHLQALRAQQPDFKPRRKVDGKDQKDPVANLLQVYQSKLLACLKDWGSLEEPSKEDKQAAAEAEKAAKASKEQDAKTAAENKMREEIRAEMLGGNFRLVTLLDCIGIVASAAKAGILARDERAAMLALRDTITHYVGEPVQTVHRVDDVVQSLTH